MISVAIDTSVLLAIFKDEEDGAAWLECLRKPAESAVRWVSPALATTDRGYLRNYFPDLKILSLPGAP